MPLITLQISCNGKNIQIGRQPQYNRTTALGNTYPTTALFYFSDGRVNAESMSSEEYYGLLSKHIDMSYLEFSTYCKHGNP